MENRNPYLGGIDGLVGGFQFVHWYKPQKYYQYSRNCDLLAVIEPLLQALRSTHAEGSLLIMSACNDDRDSMPKWNLAHEKLVAINSVADLLLQYSTNAHGMSFVHPRPTLPTLP